MFKIFLKQWFDIYIKKLFLISKNPLLDLENLLLYVIKKNKEWLIQNCNVPLIISEKKKKKLYSFLNRRIKGEPLEYILETCEFWSIYLKIIPKMFIPRHDTELLVTTTLELIKYKNIKNILEFGTGTGAISFAINKEFNNKHKIIAIDKDHISVNCAIHNAKTLHIKNIKFLIGNWFKNLKFKKKFDLIISNPPYVDENDVFYKYLGNHFESYITTLSKANGFNDLFRIIYTSNKFYLKKGGWLILEHGWYQSKLIKKFLLFNNFKNIFSIKDYFYNNIITVGKKT